MTLLLSYFVWNFDCSKAYFRWKIAHGARGDLSDRKTATETQLHMKLTKIFAKYLTWTLSWRPKFISKIWSNLKTMYNFLKMKNKQRQSKTQPTSYIWGINILRQILRLSEGAFNLSFHKLFQNCAKRTGFVHIQPFQIDLGHSALQDGGAIPELQWMDGLVNKTLPLIITHCSEDQNLVTTKIWTFCPQNPQNK